ncbi:MAG TPA: MmcQ/YjbR family DNA-binding protein [Spirochaetota bacterium]|nr:MmcQ/YjbR family DNA-binding protein [Spirochaetota bacterium]HPJ38855.1 MmcQ/YjbR family DNA-binding protein [Spirochaetota bacterium]HPQ53170.1 MmcQ/YjbR family DNA-binding protein [Spirochaetota bacterium]
MLTLKKIRSYCSRKKGVSEDFPFDMETLVLRVGSKIFLLSDINEKPFRMNLKCDPFRSMVLREKYNQITPGYHMNKKHWNTVLVDGVIPDNEVLELVDHSYELVLKGMKKSERDEILQE